MNEFETEIGERWKLYYCSRCQQCCRVEVSVVGLSPDCLFCGRYLRPWQSGDTELPLPRGRVAVPPRLPAARRRR